MNSIFTIIMLLVPIFIYLVVINDSFKFKGITLKKSAVFVALGCASPILVYSLSRILEIVNYESFLGPLPYFIFESVILVALLEEVTKYITYKINDPITEKPVNKMFYYVCAVVGFALIENLIYLKNHDLQTLIMRDITALPMHLFTGLIVGYFYCIKNQLWKGILLSTICHATYNIGITVLGFDFLVIIMVTYFMIGMLIRDKVLKINELENN